MNEKPKILVTGASGFIGSFLCEEGLRQGYEVWAGMRQSSSRRWLQNEWLQFQTLDMEHPDVLRSQLADFQQKHGRWDVVVHAAGATKCLHPADFDRHNFDCTVHLVEALQALDMVPSLFVYVSSLSVLGAIREDYTDLSSDDVAQPNTAYGRSKLRSEQWLQAQDKAAFPYVIFRPTGVYGPRERDYYLQAKSIRQHIDFAVGFKPQLITFVYVQDLVDAIYLAIEKAVKGQETAIVGNIYHVSDGQTYDSRQFSDLLQRCMGVGTVVHLKAPLWFLRTVCAVSDWWSTHVSKRVTTLNNDKYRILSQRNWKCDITPARRDLGYVPHWPLERGVEATVAWYRKEGWL